MPFGTHWYDLAILAVIALLFFGPKRLPEMGSAIGKTIKEFQKSMKEVTSPSPEPSQPALPPATEAKQVTSPAETTTTTTVE
ncbi:MAG: Sec-independent protein translocase subunit TatA/TatB [Ktedonobacterales bacterium]